MNRARSLDRFTLVRTRNVEEIREALSRINLNDPALHPVGRDGALDVIFNGCQLLETSLSYVTYGADIRLHFPESKLITQVFPIKGRGAVAINGVTSSLNPQHGVTLSAGTSMAAKLGANYEALVLRIDSKALQKKLGAIVGMPINDPLQFDPPQDYVSPSAKLLRDYFLFLVDQVSVSTAPLPKLMLAEFEQVLMVMLLCAQRHSCSHLLERPPSGVAPWQVRRAEEYIEANWNNPISLEGIAEATGVSVRSLFRTFSNNRDYSPMEFVKQVRLRRAREILQNPNITTTVTDVALACGFGDLSRFSKDYFQAFGERPSRVLRGSKSIGSVRH